MSVTAPTIDRDTLDAIKRDELPAFERVFRDRFPALLAAESPAPEEAVAVAHALERAFVALWQARAQLQSPEQFEAFLKAATHDAVIRVRARRAASEKMAGHAARSAAHSMAAPSVDESWARVTAGATRRTEHATAARADAPAVNARRSEAARHAAAEHVAAVGGAGGRPKWLLIAAGAVMLAGLLGVLTWRARLASDDIINQRIASDESRTIGTAAGERGNANLRDGSLVALGADTRVRIPKQFSEIKAVGLEGTATFTVTPVGEEGRPLDVRARGTSVSSGGGVFTVRAYPTDSTVTVAVREGEAVVRAAGVARPLTAGSALTIAPSGTMSELTPTQRDELLAWVDGRYVAVERPLRAILPDLARWYKLDISADDGALLDRSVSMSAGLDSSEAAIKALEQSAKVKMGWRDKAMILRDAPTAPPRGR